MSKRVSSRFARPASEHGFTLVELLVTLVVMTLASIAILSWLNQTSRVASSETARATSLNEETVAFARMLQEVRQAYAVNCPSAGCSSGATSSSIDIDERTTLSGQQDKRVSFVCNVSEPGSTLHECVRYEAAASDTSDAVPLGPSCSSCTKSVVIRRVANEPVFTKLTTGTSLSGAVRWIAGKATIYTPNNGALTNGLARYSSDVVLSQWFDMSQLSFGQ